MAEAGKARARVVFSIENMLNQYESEYHRLLQ